MSTRVRATSVSSNTTSVSSSSTTNAARPRRPSTGAKRVSFDATSVPLPIATWEELSTPSTIATEPPFPFPEPATTIRKRRSEIDSTIDLKAVLAQGIMEWRSEVDAGSVDVE